ncbi:MAG: fumarylacetoacetate hydrolase family protein [Syntrophaceae bacterium]|nr:fumarylacetoacetate hydrolase family protein [Syntrophaceae bacterium]
MRFMVGESGSSTAVYLVSDDFAVNLTELDPSVGTDLLPIIQEGRALAQLKALGDKGTRVQVSGIIPALPIAKPGKIVCLGLNYLDHIKEGGREVPQYPVFFMRGISSMIPAGAPMIRPECSDQLDYEAELMVIIGKHGRHIRESEALGHVFGYTIFNDGSVRDYQKKTHQWTPGKNFDATGAVGPTVVTPDELPIGGEGLKIEARVGQEILQSASTSDMLWSVAKIIETISEYSTLEPGDMIAMGTPPGVGFARTPPRYLRPGETIEVIIEKIGICANPVVTEETLKEINT